MTVSKGKKAIFAAGLSVGVAVLLLSYAAYGWFTSTSTVTATGMTMSASAPDNIQISLIGDDNDKNWSDMVAVDIKEVIAKQIENFDKTANLFILPVSSLAGFDSTFFATISAKADGSATDDAVFIDGLSVHKATDGYEGHYVDIPLYFRNQGADAITLALDKAGNGISDKPTAITPVKQGSKIADIARVAFLSQDKLKNSMKTDTPLVLTGDGAISPKVLVGKTPTTFGDSKYILFTNDTKLSIDDIIKVEPASYGGTDGTAYQVASMVVRIWIEGQDQACTVSVGNQEFTVDLKFSVR